MARSTSTDRVDVYEIVTDRIVAQLEAGVVPWHRPWGDAQLPTSLSSGKPYRGINVLLLGVSAAAGNFSSPWWGTYKQIEGRGGQVRKGERGTQVVLWKIFKTTDKATGEPKTIPMLRSFTVFNADQADGLTLPASEPVAPVDAIAECDQAVAAYLATGGPSFRHGGDQAYYRPSTDEVVLPPRELFESSEAYYGALFHELAHSTGHPDRLARPDAIEAHSFGDTHYSREELVAELASAFLSGFTGISASTVGASAAYLQSWITVLRGDRKLLISAAGQAQKAADLILGTTPVAPVDEAATS